MARNGSRGGRFLRQQLLQLVIVAVAGISVFTIGYTRVTAAVRTLVLD